MLHGITCYISLHITCDCMLHVIKIYMGLHRIDAERSWLKMLTIPCKNEFLLIFFIHSIPSTSPNYHSNTPHIITVAYNSVNKFHHNISYGYILEFDYKLWFPLAYSSHNLFSLFSQFCKE